MESEIVVAPRRVSSGRRWISRTPGRELRLKMTKRKAAQPTFSCVPSEPPRIKRMRTTAPMLSVQIAIRAGVISAALGVQRYTNSAAAGVVAAAAARVAGAGALHHASALFAGGTELQA